MKLVQLTPGAGEMYCGNCLRDNALVAQWNRMGIPAVMVPLYLPLTLDEEDQSASQPVFFGGVNVYLEQRIPWLWKFVPQSWRRQLDSRFVLKRIGKLAAKTQPARVGGMTVSMLRGEHGRQIRELQALTDWLKTEQKPDVVLFSNALLLGMQQSIRRETGAKTTCFLAGEDGFLDALPEPFRTESWTLMKEQVREVDVLIAPSRYYADFIAGRLELERERIHVVPNGLNFDGYDAAPEKRKDATPLTLGFFARMSFEKGVDKLVEAYIEIRRRNSVPDLKLIVAGNRNPWNEPLVSILEMRLLLDNLTSESSFHPNVSREEKIRLLEKMDVFCVPTQGNEPFGYYVVEALAAGVPVVLPNRTAFPEIVEATGGGILYEPGDKEQMIDAIQRLCGDEQLRNELSESARKTARELYSIETVAKKITELVS